MASWTMELVAPITLIEVYEPDCVWYPAWGPNPIAHVPLDQRGRCAICGQQITWEVLVRDARRRLAVIGRDCSVVFGDVIAARVSVAVRRAKTRGEAAAAREPVRAELLQLRSEKGALLRALPHPSNKSFARRLTLYDYLSWWLDQGPKAKPEELRAALALIQGRLAGVSRPLAGMSP